MLERITASGLHFSVDENALDNMELMDALVELQDSDNKNAPRASIKVAEMLLGKQGKQDIYEQIKTTHNGRVPTTVFIEALREIFEAIGETGKKS